jgi:hypothetical protein
MPVQPKVPANNEGLPTAIPPPQTGTGKLWLTRGMSLLLEFYEVEHTLPMDDTISALTAVCRNNGGTLE